MYPYADSMATEVAKPVCFWHVIKLANYFQKGYINAIVMYNILQEHRLIVVNPNRSRHFRLDVINREQLLTLNGV